MPTRRRANGVGTTLHRVAYRVTGGRVGHHLSDGANVLLLTTTAPGGHPRTWPLRYARDCESWLVVPAASAGGAPDWLADVGAVPDVVVQVRGRRFPATAVVVDGEARDALWWTFARRYPDVDRPDGVTEARPPVVVLRERSRDTADVLPADLLLGT